MKNQKGFIQIPLLIIVIISIAVASAGAGVVLHKQGKLASLTADISGALKQNEETTIVKDEETKQEELQSEEPKLEVEPIEKKVAQQEINENEIVQQEQKLAEKTKPEFQESSKEVEEIKENPIIGYSKLNPAPLLTPIIIKGKYDSYIYKWKITVLEFLRGSQALNKMQEKCETVSLPHCCWDFKNTAPGYEYLLVKLKVECIQGVIFDKTIISKPRCDSGGVKFGSGFTVVSSNEKEFSSVGQLCWGKNLGRSPEERISSTDWLAFRVPSGDSKILLRYTEYTSEHITNSTAWFQVY